MILPAKIMKKKNLVSMRVKKMLKCFSEDYVLYKLMCVIVSARGCISERSRRTLRALATNSFYNDKCRAPKLLILIAIFIVS